MDYNTSREKLVMPEYGRNIQLMVNHALTIEDRDERTRCVATIVNIMGNLFPSIKEDANYEQKLWDHVAMISGYRLDVDSPYPLPQKPAASAASEKHIPYPQTHIRFRLYGSIVHNTLLQAMRCQDEKECMQMVAYVAKYMKQVILQYGKDNNAEEKVAADIAEMTDGALKYSYAELMNTLPHDDYQQQQQSPYRLRQQRYQDNQKNRNNYAHNNNYSRNNNSNNNYGRNNNKYGKKRY